MATCTNWFYSEDQDGDYIFGAVAIYRAIGGSWVWVINKGIDKEYGVSTELEVGGIYKAVPDYDREGYTTPKDQKWTACDKDITLVYEKILTTCTQSFTANSNVGELPFTPQLLLYIGYEEQPWTLVGTWNLPADVEDLTIGTVYTARPIIPSSYTGDDFTAPEAVTFTACESAINFVYTSEIDKNGGVYTVLHNVVSTNLKAVGWAQYTPALPLLEVEFLSGSLYLYYYVPKSIYEGLMMAVSKGYYFWLFIRCKTFDCSGGDIPYAYKRLR